MPIFFVLWIGWKLIKRTRWIPLEEIDFYTGRRELDEMEAADEVRYKPDSWWQKMLSYVF